MQQYALMLVFLALAVGYTFWMRGRASKALENARPAFVSFFQRTGYRYADLPDAPPEAQADRSYADAKNPRTDGTYQIHYIRDYHGIRIHYTSSNGSRKEGSKTIYWYSNQWEAEVPNAPRVPLHIADRSLDSTLKAAKEMFSNSKRVFTPKCSQRVQTGIPQLDSKFVVFGDNPQAVQAVLAQNPALVQMLDGWAELDVSVTHGRAVFADPSQHNMTAAMGGNIGSMALGFDYAKRLELGIPVHDRIADLFAALIRATA
jgi:hypothetical protein